MCSWCWGFTAAFNQLVEALSGRVEVVRLLGGLAEDTAETMSTEMQTVIMTTWQRIETVIPGVTFNYNFWHHCQPRRSTYPACRAVIAARQQGTAHDVAMTTAIQRAYYQQALNPSDDETLIQLAADLRLDIQQFTCDLGRSETHVQLKEEMDTARRLGVDSFPSLLVQGARRHWHIPVNYTDASPMLEMIDEILGAQ